MGKALVVVFVQDVDQEGKGGCLNNMRDPGSDADGCRGLPVCRRAGEGEDS